MFRNIVDMCEIIPFSVLSSTNQEWIQIPHLSVPVIFISADVLTDGIKICWPADIALNLSCLHFPIAL